MGAFQWVQYVHEHTQTSKVYGIPDSGIFLIDFYNPISKAKDMRIGEGNILKLFNNMDDLAPPVVECYKELGDLISCNDATNYAQYIKVPVLMVQSIYDEYILSDFLGVDCVTNKNSPRSIATCNSTARSAIEEYRKAVVEAISKMKERKSDLGIWGVACIQHGFSIYSSFTNP